MYFEPVYAEVTVAGARAKEFKAKIIDFLKHNEKLNSYAQKETRLPEKPPVPSRCDWDGFLAMILSQR